VPPMEEQERILKLLDEAAELQKLRGKADDRTATLIPALFHEMFGDVLGNGKGWTMSELLLHIVDRSLPCKSINVANFSVGQALLPNAGNGVPCCGHVQKLLAVFPRLCTSGNRATLVPVLAELRCFFHESIRAARRPSTTFENGPVLP
jgi:hypothetical protein